MTIPTPAPRDPDGDLGKRPDDSGTADATLAWGNGHPAYPLAYPDQPGASGGGGGAMPIAWSTEIAPTTPVPASRPSRRIKGAVALVTAAVVAALGLPIGWMWSSFAPWLPGVVESDGVFLQQPYGEQRAGQETWFILLSIGAGIVVAIVAWVALRRFRGPVMVVALAVGGVAAGWNAWRFGHNIGRGHALDLARHGKIGDVVLLPPDLRIKQTGDVGLWHGWLPYLSGVLLYLAIAAIVTYLLIASFTSSPTLMLLGRHERAAGSRPSIESAQS